MCTTRLMKQRNLCIAMLGLSLLGCGGGGSGTGGGEQDNTAAASFLASTATPVTGAAVLFTDASSGTPSAWYWEFGDGSTSNQENTGHVYSTPGSYTVRLTVTTAAGRSSAEEQVSVTSASNGNGPQFTMNQTLSDGAQRTTLAFSGLAMMTGNLAAQSFFPPGKVADYTGFQYLRDNDPDNMGHNTSFLTRVANNVLYLLTDEQIAQLSRLASSQLSLVQQYGYERFVIMQAFRELMDGTAPTPALDLASVINSSRELYQIDGQISFERAELYASIYASLDLDQQSYLDAMAGKGWASWPDVTDAMVQSKLAGLPQGSKVLVMTYASDLFSWYAGTLDADIYFCPERHGTYYGGFYMKDAPAVGHEGYGIDEQLTATAGSVLSDSRLGYVSAEQASLMSGLVQTQRNNLFTGANNMVQLRTDIALLLRSLRNPETDSAVVLGKVLELSGLYGELDGENNYHYATVFHQLYASLSRQQKNKLIALRKSIMSGTYADGTTFDFSTATTPYLYSDPIDDLNALTPYLNEVDGLFGY